MKKKKVVKKIIKKKKKKITKVNEFIEKNPIGAPPKYREHFCEDIIDHLTQGGSIDSFGAYLGNKYGKEYRLHKDTVFEWLRKDSKYFKPNFSDSRKIGEAYSMKYYEDVGKLGMTGQLRTMKAEVPLLNEQGQAILDINGKPVMKKIYTAANFNAAVWIFKMKNRFGWTSNIKISGDADAPIITKDCNLQNLSVDDLKKLKEILSVSNEDKNTESK